MNIFSLIKLNVHASRIQIRVQNFSKGNISNKKKHDINNYE